MDELKAYTIGETADILKISKRCVYQYVEAGALRGVKIGKAWRITSDALREFLAMGAPIVDGNRRKENRNSEACA